MEFRKIFDTIPEQFDKFRPRYSQELFDFKPETPYPHRSFHYQNATNYGYVDFEERDFYGKREMTSEWDLRSRHLELN